MAGVLGAAVVIAWTAIENWHESSRVLDASPGYGPLIVVAASAVPACAAATRGAIRSRAAYARRSKAVPVAAMAAAIGGLDALVFTGGVGEHAPGIRARAADGLAFLGVELDPGANARATADADIGASGAAVRAVVVTAREDLEVVRQVRALLVG